MYIWVTKFVEGVSFIVLFIITFCYIQEYTASVSPFRDVGVKSEAVFFFTFSSIVGSGAVVR